MFWFIRNFARNAILIVWIALSSLGYKEKLDLQHRSGWSFYMFTTFTGSGRTTNEVMMIKLYFVHHSEQSHFQRNIPMIVHPFNGIFLSILSSSSSIRRFPGKNLHHKFNLFSRLFFVGNFIPCKGYLSTPLQKDFLLFLFVPLIHSKTSKTVSDFESWKLSIGKAASPFLPFDSHLHLSSELNWSTPSVMKKSSLLKIDRNKI